MWHRIWKILQKQHLSKTSTIGHFGAPAAVTTDLTGDHHQNHHENSWKAACGRPFPSRPRHGTGGSAPNPPQAATPLHSSRGVCAEPATRVAASSQSRVTRNLIAARVGLGSSALGCCWLGSPAMAPCLAARRGRLPHANADHHAVVVVPHQSFERTQGPTVPTGVVNLYSSLWHSMRHWDCGLHAWAWPWPRSPWTLKMENREASEFFTAAVVTGNHAQQGSCRLPVLTQATVQCSSDLGFPVALSRSRKPRIWSQDNLQPTLNSALIEQSITVPAEYNRTSQ